MAYIWISDWVFEYSGPHNRVLHEVVDQLVENWSTDSIKGECWSRPLGRDDQVFLYATINLHQQCIWNHRGICLVDKEGSLSVLISHDAMCLRRRPCIVMKPAGIQLQTAKNKISTFTNDAHLGRTAAQYKVKCVILYDCCGARLFNQGIQGLKVGSIWGNMVHDVRYWVRFALHHNVFHT